MYWKYQLKHFYITKLYIIKILSNQLIMHSVSNELNQKEGVNINHVSNEYFWDWGSN